MASTVTWPGQSGKSYSTELCVFGRAFHNYPGVYIVCKPASTNGRWDALYVGETDDFNRRLNTEWANHHRLDCIKRNGATNVCVIVVNGGKEARTAIETDLRNRLDPPCNRQ